MKLLAAFLVLATASVGYPGDPVDRVADALIGVLSASGTGRVAAQRHAAAVLSAEGAHAMAGDQDVAANWGGRQPAYRMRALGPAYRGVTLAPGQVLHLEQTFLAGQRAQILAASGGRAPFELTIDDGEGRRSCPTQDRRARCDWIPTATTRIAIDLYNRGGTADRFILVLR